MMQNVQQYAQQGYQQVVQYASQALNLNMSCLDVLDQAPGLLIKQKFQLFEALTGCQQQNQYKIYAANEQGEKQKGRKALFKAKEKSDCCPRVCLSPFCRPFEVSVTNYGCDQSGLQMGKKEKDDHSRRVFHLIRKYACTFYCLNRPKLEVKYTENGKDQHLGTIIDPWFCCNYGVHVVNEVGVLRYRIIASCCQSYFWCNLPCQSCNRVEFKIFDASGQHVGNMVKEGKSCMKNLVGAADNFKLIFPKGATKQDKGLLLAAVILIDYSYFEEKQGRGQNQVGAA